MAHVIDIEEPLCENSLYNTPGSNEDAAPACVSALAGTQGCGLFILVDKILKKQHLSYTTARLALDLLRGINRKSIVVEPSPSDDPKSFVAKTLNTAKEIVENGNDPNSPLFMSAKRFTESLQKAKQQVDVPVSVENAWQDFSLHYYRERLYQFLRQ